MEGQFKRKKKREGMKRKEGGREERRYNFPNLEFIIELGRNVHK